MSELLKSLIEMAIREKKLVSVTNNSGKYGGLVYVLEHDGTWIKVSYDMNISRWFLLPVSEITAIGPHHS